MMRRKKLGKWKQVTAAFLAGIMFTSVAPTSLQAQAANKGTVQVKNAISSGVTLKTDGDLTEGSEETTSTERSYSTISAVAAYVSKNMTNRESHFSVIYTGSDYDIYGDRGKIKNDLLPKAFSVDTANTSDADYLFHIYKSIDVDYVVNPTNKYIHFTFDVEYWESKEETEYVDDNLSTIISDMALSEGATDYDKVKAVHDWICGNVKKGKSVISEVDGKTEIATLTPYTAFKYGQASSAGYAGLAYKLLSKMGIQSAIIRGTEQGTNTKVWNLVKLDGMWYHMSIYEDDKDSANDGLDNATYDYTYFLLGTNTQRKKLPVGSLYSGYTAYYDVSEEDYFADDDPIFTEDGKKSLYGITAQFVGQEQEIGSFISKGQILVYAYYSKDDYDLKQNSASVRVFDIAPMRVERQGDNTVTVTYMGKTCKINVVGSNTPATDGKLKIDFVANGGSAVDSITDISKNQTISLSSITPTREGYQFGGWYLDSTLQTKCPTKFTITQSITLYAKWEKTGVSALKVTYKGKPLNVDTVYEVDANGDTIIADNGKPSILRWEAALNRADLEVMAYNTDGTEGLISDYNIRLKEGKNNFDCAYEEPLLLFNKNGTTFPAYGQSIVMEVEKDGKTDTFEVYLAEYWGEDENVTSGTVKIEVYEDVSEDGVPGTPTVVEVSRYSRFSESGIEEPSRATETFGGWYTETDYVNRVTDYTRITEDTKIYAKWVKKTLKSMMVEYTGTDMPIWSDIDLNNVLVKAFYDDYSVKTILDSYEISSTLIENEGTNVFTVKYQETNPYDADEIISFTKTFTVEGYIPNEETYRVSFDSMGGSVVESITGVAEGETITLPNPPTKEGFVFGGWYRDTSCKVPFTETSKVTKDITLYAKWEEFQLVAYSLEAAYIGDALYVNDGIPKESIRVIAMYNDNVARLVDDFTYTPNTILQEGVNVITVNYEDLNAAVVIETGTPAKTYTITFDSCGGNEVESIKNIIWGDTVTLPKAVKSGAEFEGWYTSKEYTTEFTEKDFVTRDMTLYAKWNEEAQGSVTPTAVADGKVTPTAAANITPQVTQSVTPAATPSSGAATPTGSGSESSKKTVESITAEYLGNDLAVGSTIAKENILVTATYSDGTTATVKKFTLDPETIKTVGKNVVVVKYKEKSATITINGVEVTPAPTQAAATAAPTATSGAGAKITPTGSAKTSSTSTDDSSSSSATPKDFQDKVNSIFNKIKNGNSDASIEDIAEVVNMLHEMTPRELSEIDEDVLRTLDTMILNLSNVSVVIENHIENYPVTEKDVWGLGLILTSSDILSGNKVEVILDISEAAMTSGIRNLLEQYAIIQDKNIFKYLDIRLYKYIEKANTTRDEDKQPIYETLLPVHLTLPIPVENQGEPYYCVIREHEEQVVAISDYDSSEETISFESNCFSIYGLAYGNTQAEELVIEEGETITADTPENTSGTGDADTVSTKTKGNSTLPFILAAIAVIAFAIMVITIVIVKELNKKDEDEEAKIKTNDKPSATEEKK
ncbi:MAG: InlB B-repeat-containing protein [Lachnospiraceae bacterium]|nr:InlB B-repeat-containing protein [Lachnospiraceae bacterium]